MGNKEGHREGETLREAAMACGGDRAGNESSQSAASAPPLAVFCSNQLQEKDRAKHSKASDSKS